tara:strand:- start:613 stop:750 length:138 start_codon:yes stop_codon:yes gene_type:complete
LYPTITDRDFTVATVAAPKGGLSDAEEGDENVDTPEGEEENKSDS